MNPVVDAQRAAARTQQRQSAAAGVGAPITKQPRLLHPQANSALLWGVPTFLFCAILTPIAWKKSNDARSSYNSRPGAYTGKVRILVGMGLGILGTLYLVTLIVVGVLILTGVVGA